jgi:hypothetical protein
MSSMVTFERLYRSPGWRGPMIVSYRMFEGGPTACEWMVPNSDKAEQPDSETVRPRLRVVRSS